MTIIKSAYETTACKGYVLTKIIHELNLGLLNSGIYQLGTEHDQLKFLRSIDAIRFVTTCPETATIPAFSHPISHEFTISGRKVNLVITDQRAPTRWIDQSGEYVIKNASEFSFNAVRAYLQHFWNTENPELLLNNSKFAMQVYSKLISETVTRAFGLNPRDQLTIAILASYFYCCLHTNQTEFNEMELMRLTSIIGKVVNTDMNTVMNIIENVPPIQNVEGLCESIKTATENVRLDKFNWGMLFSVLFGSWFGGANPKELISVSLEHPPTWLAIVMSSLNDRTYKNTNIGKISLGLKTDQQTSFIHAMNNMMATLD